MIAAELFLAIACAAAAQAGAKEGVVAGTVLNASRGKAPAAGAEVVLEIRVGGAFVPFHEAKADAGGRFRFERLPVGTSYRYRLGANHDGVHYPGSLVELTAQRPAVSADVEVCDSSSEPNPLVIRRQDISLRSEPGVLYVTETILVDNPTSTCYVGRVPPGASEPITLQLAIPSDFQRATFHKEFFGRRFGIADGKLVTAVPWPPGERELKFTYTLPNNNPSYRWIRPLDLPCSALRVRIASARPAEVACNLPRGPDEGDGILTFESGGGALSAGHVVSVELGRLPVPFMAYARWVALATLALLMAAASVNIISSAFSSSRIAQTCGTRRPAPPSSWPARTP